MGKLDEIKSGGIKGCLGLDQIDWGGQAGAIYECWKLRPCCGQSGLEPKQCICCILHFWCVPMCSCVKMYASSADQPCNIVPHCLCMWCFPFCATWFMRYNLRKKNGVSGNILGDFVCTYCCSICNACQLLRGSQNHDWMMIPCNFTPVAPEMMLLK